MSKLNKLVTNYPVELTEEEISNLSGTLAPVIAACGGGGGGTGGKIYTGIGFVTVNNTTNQIGLTNEANTKLNQDIPTKVSDLSDSANYQTVAEAASTYQTIDGMSAYATTSYVNGVTGSIYYTSILGLVDALSAKQDTLTFGYDENDAISSINSHKLAGAGGVTGDYYSASNPSGFINSTQAETQILAKNYITSGVSELENFYSKTDTSSKTEIANAIKDFITEDDVLEKHYLTKASGDLLYVPIPQGLSDGQYYAMTTSSWKVIQGAGDVSGISTVAHDDTLTGNGNNENLGVDITKIQTKLTDAQIQNITDVTTLKTASSTWDKVSAKLNTADFNTYTGTTAPSTYQPIGNYLSSNALDGYATQQWVEQQGYIKQETDWTNIIQEASAKAYNDATANANSLYQAKGDYVKNTDISLDANNKITAISGKELIITAHQSLTDYYTKSQTSGAIELSTEFGKYALKSEIPTVPTKVSDLTDSANYYKTTETSSKNELSTEFAKYLTNTQYNTDSATFALKTDLNDLVSSASVTSTETDYVMTTTGWKVLTLPGGGMTQVYHDTTLTGDGNANNNQLGVKWETLSGNTIVSAEKAGEAQGFRWGDNTYQDTSAALTNLWNSKNHVTLQTANNILTVDNNDNTSATLSAMSYVNNTLNNRAFLPQKACVCLESEITTMATLANGQGMLFFVVSAH